MLPLDQFCDYVLSCLKTKLNDEQRRCVRAPPNKPLMIIAGPGSGKTTVLVLRALRHLFVDGFAPEQIVVTTFTRKAATEIRTRWLDWGTALQMELIAAAKAAGDAKLEKWAGAVDLNRCVTGTLDSICEELLGDFRGPDEIPPVMVEGFAANQILARNGFQKAYYDDQSGFDGMLSQYTFSGDPPQTFGEVVGAARPLLDRLIHDRVDIKGFASAKPHTKVRKAFIEAMTSYEAALRSSGQLDFAYLERNFLEKLAQGALKEGVGNWRAVLVDEYQDTNPLQEEIYFEIVRGLGTSLTVVGDDDQSLYRFRGATVELFRDFAVRLKAAVSLDANVEYLFKNYRSPKEVVDFYNAFVTTDAEFKAARVGKKPLIQPEQPACGVQVLGMFRPDVDDLAVDLAGLLHDVFVNGVFERTVNGQKVSIRRNKTGGDFGDAVMLGHTINEIAGTRSRLPMLLRAELNRRGVNVFNPRGRALRDLLPVQTLLGLVLECLDPQSASRPEGSFVPDMKLTRVVRTAFAQWRTAANAFIRSNPAPNAPHTIAQFIVAWNKQKPQTGAEWPSDWPFLELLFKLMTWMPQFQNDPEHQVWLEAISRAVSQAALFSPYDARLLRDDPHRERSRQSIIRDILRPVADGLVDVDEDIMPSIPRNYLAMMTIHQAKGLEFPFVIVDVASDYKTNHVKQRFRRFPENPSSVAVMESELAPYCAVGAARMKRSDMDRTFDDLVRLHYVAYSRPQNVLLLVGVDKALQYGSAIKHVGLFWRRDGSWAWQKPVKGNSPPLVNAHPLTLI
jgi:DNA helicase II / ATP-dependent DNA helicase PcrA